MIDRERARQIAIDWIASHPAQGPDGMLELCILDGRTRELDFGWLFFYTSKLFRETGDFQYALAGNGPSIVDRRDSTCIGRERRIPLSITSKSIGGGDRYRGE